LELKNESMKLIIYILILLLLDSCCIGKVDCNPPFYDAMKIETCCVDIKEILDSRMYLYEKNSNFKNVKDTMILDFNSMYRSAVNTGPWVVPFNFKNNYYDVYNYDFLAFIGGKRYEITEIQYESKDYKCGCQKITLKSYKRNGQLFNKNIISIYD
jgi:hypothetical protein